jgi:hypothetical protein
MGQTVAEQSEMVNRAGAASQATVQRSARPGRRAKAESVIVLAERADEISASGDPHQREPDALTSAHRRSTARRSTASPSARQIGLITETVKDLADQATCSL